MIHALLIFLYVIVSVFLVLVVLLQTGKRADLAGAFGGGGSQTALGTRGAANLLTKLTTVSAILFMLLALVLSIRTTRNLGAGSVLDEVPDEAGSSAPAPAPAPAPETTPLETVPGDPPQPPPPDAP
jgi:preprotein translocase subunit SecG